MKLKICGMKMNTEEVSALRPDYMGFIFWEGSARFFKGEIPQIQPEIKKVGVFVDAKMQSILALIDEHGLDAVQLHGKESPQYCEAIKSQSKVEVIKVFSIKNEFDFSTLQAYERVCDFYLFDTKGKLPGGNGYAFDWSVLRNYPSTKPYFLSGGIGLQEVVSLKKFMERPESEYFYAVDVNSRFEIEAGLKDIDALKQFKNLVSSTV